MKNTLIFFLGLAVGIGLGSVLAGSLSHSALLSDRDVVVVKAAEEGWIDVYRQGERESEWCEEDGETYVWLSRLLRGSLPETPVEAVETGVS